jgi:hypothetical protein
MERRGRQAIPAPEQADGGVLGLMDVMLAEILAH